MADPFADVNDYEVRTGQTLSTEEQAQVTELLGEASALIRLYALGIDDRITAGIPDATLVTGLCVRMVRRYLANPEQAAALTTGPYTSSWAAANSRGLWLAADDLALLNPPVQRTTPRGVGTIRLSTVVGTARPGPARSLPPWA